MTTCSCFVYPDCQKEIYTSTHLGNKKFPEKPDYSMAYVWNLYPDYDVFLTGTGFGGIALALMSLCRPGDEIDVSDNV